MTMHIEHRRGKDYLVIDTRPSKKIRKAQERINKRQKEIYQHFKDRIKK